jgi:hypothetical protein
MPVEREVYGRHLIKSWEMGKLWQARAFLGEHQVGETIVSDERDEAIRRIKAALDQREILLTAGKGEDGSPSAIEYAEAFARLGRLPPSYEAMLDAHLAAPDYSITATQLAEAAGFENYNAANLHYGKLGEMLSRELGWLPPKRDNGDYIWTAVIAGWPGEPSLAELDRAMQRADATNHFEWQMRPQVVQALSSKK